MTISQDMLIQPLIDHAYDKHHVRENRFNNPKYGMPLEIGSPADLKAHVLDVLHDQETWGFQCYDGRETYYNSRNNTLVILNPKTTKRQESLMAVLSGAIENVKQSSHDFMSAR